MKNDYVAIQISIIGNDNNITIGDITIYLTESNREPLYHLVRKHALTTQTETKKFLEKIFKLYEKGDIEISMATLRVIEYMDDELLNAIVVIYDRITPKNPEYLLADAFPDREERIKYWPYTQKMREHQLIWDPTSTYNGDRVYYIHQPALDIYNMYKSK